MFGWFAPKCPLETWEKTWTEWRMRWLANTFGIEQLLRAEVVLPTEKFFPGEYHGTIEDVERILIRLCDFLPTNPRTVAVALCPNDEMPGAVGLYFEKGEQAAEIHIAESQLANPTWLIATLAHELAHHILLGEQRLPPEVYDHEWVTDLLPVFFGLGVFAANSTVHQTEQTLGNWHQWTVGRQGYLPSRMFGYAMALFLHVRGEGYPRWASHLRLDASSALKAGLRYLNRGGESLFHRDMIRTASAPLTACQIVDRLRAGTASFRLSALWEARDHAMTEPDLLRAIANCLTDRDSAVATGAAEALSAAGTASAMVVPELVAALSRPDMDLQIAAAQALGTIAANPEIVVPELRNLLFAADRPVVLATAQALQPFGPQAKSVMKPLLAALIKAIVDANHSEMELLADTVIAISPHPEQTTLEYLEEIDGELREQAVAAVRERLAAREQSTADASQSITGSKTRPWARLPRPTRRRARRSPCRRGRR